MTQIVLEIDNDKDTRLFLDLAERLNVRFRTGIDMMADKNLMSEEEHKLRVTNLQKFRGSLKKYKGYEPSKSEFYEQ
jgi:hypothetical protein